MDEKETARPVAWRVKDYAERIQAQADRDALLKEAANALAPLTAAAASLDKGVSIEAVQQYYKPTETELRRAQEVSTRLRAQAEGGARE